MNTNIIIWALIALLSMSAASAVSISQQSRSITVGSSLAFEAAGQDISYYEWDFGGAIPAKTVNGRYMFYTSTEYDGNLGSDGAAALQRADALCNEQLRAAGIPGSCRAILSTKDVAAIDRIPESADGYYNMKGEKVADNKADLTALKPIGGGYNLLQALIFNELGETSSNKNIWTGSFGNLKQVAGNGYTCSDWSTNADSRRIAEDTVRNAQIGVAGNTVYPWPWAKDTLSCSSKAHLYGVQTDAAKVYEGTKIRMKNPGSFQFNTLGVYTISVRGVKADGQVEQAAITLTVVENKAPVITLPGNQEVDENQQIQFPVIALDPENDALTFAVQSNARGFALNTAVDSRIGQEDLDILAYYFGSEAKYNPIADLNNDGQINILDISEISTRFGAQKGSPQYNPKYDLSNKIRIFSWAPGFSDAGQYPLTFTVTDALGHAVSQAIVLTVRNVNRLPSIPQLLSPAANGENAPVSSILSWSPSTDPDGETVSYKVYVGTLQNPPLVIEQAGTSYAPALQYSTTYYWKIAANDGKGLVESSVRRFTTAAQVIPPQPSTNQPPVITSTAVTAVAAGTAYAYQVAAADPENAPLSYSLSAAPGGMTVSGSGLITWNPSAANIGVHQITIVVSDGQKTASQSYTLTVGATGTNQPPVITSTAGTGATVGTPYTYQITAADPEGSALTYALQQGPQGMAVSASGLITWTPTAQQTGQQTGIVRVTDSSGSTASQQFTITVTQAAAPGANSPPVITAFSPLQAALTLADFVNQVFSVTASDPDNNPLTYRWTFNSADTGVTTPTYTFNKAAGTYTVEVTVSDGQATATKSWSVSVTARPVSTGFDGATTNFVAFTSDSQLASATNVILEKLAAGKIEFGSSALDLRDVVDLPGSVVIGDGIVAIDSSRYPQLNKPAAITMRNVNFAGAPAIFMSSTFTSDKNAVTAPCTTCSSINYNSVTKVLTFSVSGFSTFVARDAGKLIVSDLDVKIGGSTNNNVANGATVGKKAQPGDDVELRVKVKNAFTSAQDTGIKDILLKATVKSIDDGTDIEEESDEFDLRADRDKLVTLRFTVPFEVSADTYQVIIEGDGSGEDGLTHTLRWSIQLAVEKDSHDVRIIAAELGNQELSCVRRTTLNVEVMNIGRDEEEDVRIAVKSEQLGIEVSQEATLDDAPFSDDNSWQKSITVDASALRPGSYPISITVLRDGKQEDSKTLDVLVSECTIASAPAPTPEQKVEVILPQPRQGVQQDFTALYVVGLAGAAVVVFILVIVALASLVRGSRRRGMKNVGRR